MIHTVYRYTLALALGAGLGCGNDDDDDGGGPGGATDAEVQSACETYCDKSVVCDADVTEPGCIADCKNNVGNCMADEQEQVLDDLEVCADKACDEFTKCTIGAGFQCVFGI